jgi:phosphoglycolate/pyridoxal phosphate phosphatase family enzyme
MSKRTWQTPFSVACVAGASLQLLGPFRAFSTPRATSSTAVVPSGAVTQIGVVRSALDAVRRPSGLTSLAVAGSAGIALLAASVRRRSTARGQVSCRAKPEKLLCPAGWLNNIDIFIFDCDGVIWRGDSVIEGVPAVLDKLRAAGKRCFFVTNNSTKSRKGYKSKFDSLGLNVPPEEIFSSSFAAAAYLEQTKFKDTGKKVYIIGEKGIGEELDLIGVPWFGAEQDKDKQPFMGAGGTVDHDHNVGAVVVGFDRYVNYYKIQYAQLCINENPGCQFIATNLDRVTHLTDAQEWAGNGSMVGAIKGCTGKEPLVVGKPSPLMIDYLEAKYNIPNRQRICMVGDRLDTDILFGRDNGLQTCLTLSGVTTEKKLLSDENTICPNVYVNSINDFFP